MAVKEKDGFCVSIEENLGLVHAFAKRYVNRGVDYDDLYGAGCVGLVKAAKAFDESRGCAFSTYAVPVIVGEMKRLFRDDGSVKVSRKLKELYLKIQNETERFKKRTGREPKISELAAILNEAPEEISLALQSSAPPMSLSVLYEGEEEESLDLPCESYESSLLTKIELQRAMKLLSKEEAALIRLRYVSELSQQKTAEILNTTQVSISRKERKILKKLREILKEE